MPQTLAPAPSPAEIAVMFLSEMSAAQVRDLGTVAPALASVAAILGASR